MRNFAQSKNNGRHVLVGVSDEENDKDPSNWEHLNNVFSSVFVLFTWFDHKLDWDKEETVSLRKQRTELN